MQECHPRRRIDSKYLLSTGTKVKFHRPCRVMQIHWSVYFVAEQQPESSKTIHSEEQGRSLRTIS